MSERCEAHGMAPGLCTVRDCPSYDGGADRDGKPKRIKRKLFSKSIRSARATNGVREQARRSLKVLGPSELPKTRGDCIGGVRPCPFVSCKFHLYVDVGPLTGTLKLNFPDIEPDQMPISCALDVADMGGMHLEDIAQVMNVTRERVRQIEITALSKLEDSALRKDEVG